MSGWQTTLGFDANQIEILNVKGLALDIQFSNFSLHQKNEGLIPISFSTSKDQDFENGTALFEITYSVKDKINKKNHDWYLSSESLKSEAYRSTNEIVNIGLKALKKKVAEITSVSPNPWIGQTTIEFDIPENEKVEWQFFDVSGKLIFSQDQECQRGKNTFNIRKSQMNTTGVVYVKLITKSNTAQYKMMIIN